MRRSTTTATSADQGTARAPALTTLRRVAPYLWPDGQAWVKRRVIVALLFLLAAKLVSVSTPYVYKLAVGGTTLPSRRALPACSRRPGSHQSSA